MTIRSTMQAVRLTAWGTEPQLLTVPVPVPRAGELLLRVDAAGLCHSDLHVADADEGVLPYEPPFTLGHEVAGTVVEVGPGVSEQWLGEPVGVFGVWSCGECRRCRDGRENSCLRLSGPAGCGLGYDGGLAEFVLVPSDRFLVKACGVVADQLAPLTDAGLTAYHAVSANLDALGGDAVALVVGVGGVGHLAIQVLRALSAATVVAVDPRESARSLARRCGVHLALADLALVGGALHAEGGADVVLDFVGSDATLAAASALLAPGGRLVVVGSAGGHLVAAKGRGLPLGWQISAPFWGPRSDLDAVVALAARGALVAETETATLGDVPELYRRLRRGEITGRAVVVPNGSGRTVLPAGQTHQHWA
jgi:propanol-preferring alcohol dehydrogenase